MEREIQHPMLDLQDIVARARDVLRNLASVRSPQDEGAQNEHVEGALQELGAVD